MIHKSLLIQSHTSCNSGYGCILCTIFAVGETPGTIFQIAPVKANGFSYKPVRVLNTLVQGNLLWGIVDRSLCKTASTQLSYTYIL